MPTTPLVTILLSIHNGAATLDRCLRSVFEQSDQRFMVVAIDDFSSDSTPEILKRWQATFGHECFRIITNEVNLGLTRSLNRGLEAITTKYTARIDADDWWHKEKLEQQIQFLETHPDYGVIGTAYTNISHKQERVVIPPLTHQAIERDMFRRNPFAHSTVMFRTELIQQAGNYDPKIRYGQDYELWLRVFPRTRFANLATVLCSRDDGASQALSYKNQDAQMWQYLKTQFRYLHLLKRSLLDYRFLIVPLLTILTPKIVRDLKRKYL